MVFVNQGGLFGVETQQNIVYLLQQERGLYTLWVDIAFVDRKGCF